MAKLKKNGENARQKTFSKNFGDFFWLACIPGPCTWTFPRRMK